MTTTCQATSTPPLSAGAKRWTYYRLATEDTTPCSSTARTRTLGAR